MNTTFHPEQLFVDRPTWALTMLMVGKLRAGDRQGLCRIRNVSTGGMMIETRMPLGCGQSVSIEARAQQGVTGSIAWIRDDRAGVSFDREVPLDIMLALARNRPNRVQKTRVPRGPRLQVDCRVEVQLSTGRVKAMLKDISQGGAKLTMPLVTQRHDRLLLMVPGLPMKLGIVRWACAYVGIAFAEPLSFDLLAEWLLVREATAMSVNDRTGA